MKFHRILLFASFLLVIFPFKASAQQENAGFSTSPASLPAATSTSTTTALQNPAPHLIAYYPLAGVLTDATGKNPPIKATDAKFVASKAIFCNGVPGYTGNIQGACDVSTPVLTDLDLASFTISAHFLVPRAKTWKNPVFVGGHLYRWVFIELDRDGGIQLGYNNNHRVECSVKYRYSVWHEATITFDGKTLALYLDGVRGCSVNADLNTGNQKAIMLYNASNATAFYGMLRELKVYNGIAVPPLRTPVADTIKEPALENAAPVDLILTKCPTRAELASVDADLKLEFDNDPTKDEPLACTSAEGSRDLSWMKKRVYNTLLLMKQLHFDQPLPWTKKPLYSWFTNVVKGIRFSTDIQYNSCCGDGGMMSIQPQNSGIRYNDLWIEPAGGGAGINTFLLLLAREARHGEGYPYSCGKRDQTPDEMGGFDVQYYLARWLVEHTDQSFFTSDPIRYADQMKRRIDILNGFCNTQDSAISPRKSGNELIRVNVIVADSKDQVVTGLEEENFEIYDNKKKQEIAFFSNKGAPVSLAVLVDVSGSTREYLPSLVAALNSFIGKLNDDDEVILIKFNNEVYLVKNLTSPGNILLNEQMFTPKGGTALYDAIYLALREASRKMSHAKRAVLVISDGEDRDSHYTKKQIQKLLEDDDIQVFAIDPAGKRRIKEFADVTGGRILVPGKRSESEFTRVLDSLLPMLRLQYSIDFYPTDAGDRENRHEVEIRVDPPRDTGRVSLSYKKNHLIPLP